MANLLTGNPIYIDAAATSLVNRPMDIIAIVWVSVEGAEIVADNDFALTDSNSLPVIGKRAEGDGDGLEISFPKPISVNGIQCSVIDSGECFIFTL